MSKQSRLAEASQPDGSHSSNRGGPPLCGAQPSAGPQGELQDIKRGTASQRQLPIPSFISQFL